ncbi:unnamed protein product, partial [Amoebophrya sp. A25]
RVIRSLPIKRNTAALEAAAPSKGDVASRKEIQAHDSANSKQAMDQEDEHASMIKVLTEEQDALEKSSSVLSVVEEKEKRAAAMVNFIDKLKRTVDGEGGVDENNDSSSSREKETYKAGSWTREWLDKQTKKQ